MGHNLPWCYLKSAVSFAFVFKFKKEQNGFPSLPPEKLEIFVCLSVASSENFR
ncbi:hypothetical protein MY975_06850 [Haemophilus influenzae]